MESGYEKESRVRNGEVTRSPTDSEKQFFQRNSYHQNSSTRRDVIDNMLTYINRDLLISKIFYFFFFAAFGSLFPLLAVYFKQLGMNPTQGGILIGFRPFVEFCSAPLWGVFADKWKKGKQLLLFSIFCWVAFTLSIAFVRPPAHSCMTSNTTHIFLSEPYTRRRRDAERWVEPLPEGVTFKYIADAASTSFRRDEPSFLHHHPDPVAGRRKKKPTDDYSIDHRKVANKKEGEVQGLVSPRFSTIVYREDEVQEVFLVLLLLVVVGEFFSAPAITLADSVTLSYLGDDVENYGRQRMFGSLGWGLAMFFIGLALDHSTTFPDHPCGSQEHGEKNYIICFAVFSVLMSCAFITATQFNFTYHHTSIDIQLEHFKEKVKDKIKQTVSSIRRHDRTKLIGEDFDYDPEFTADSCEESRGKGNPDKHLHISLDDRNDMVSDTVDGRASGSAGKHDDDTYFGKWFTVLRMLATVKYMLILFVAWFMGFGIGLIFTFLFWHLQDLGGSPTLFGVASVFNHISELLAYFLSVKFISSFGHIKVLYAGLLGNMARFLYISWLKSPWWVLPFEFLQGLTHAAVWASCCSYITQAIPASLRSSAQGILQGLHHGLGRGCGAVIGGIMVNYFGSEVTFRAYGVACLVVLGAFFAINHFLTEKSPIIGGDGEGHQILEETSHLAPHGVPANLMAREPSSSKIHTELNEAFDDGYSSKYGSTEESNYLGSKPAGGGNFSHSGTRSTATDYGSYTGGNPFSESCQASGTTQRLVIDTPPQAPTNMFQQQPDNLMDQSYGP